MPHMILPRHVAEERQRQKDDAAAGSIASTAVHRLDSDDWATLDVVQAQLDQLHAYLVQRREEEPTYHFPKPTGWKLMVLMLTIPDKTAGGLLTIDDAREARSLSSPQGVVLDMGPAAYTDKDRFTVNDGIKPWCEIGDRITFVKYDASLFQIANGQRFGFLNDTQPVSVIDREWEIPQ